MLNCNCVNEYVNLSVPSVCVCASDDGKWNFEVITYFQIIVIFTFENYVERYITRLCNYSETCISHF